jgi:hypothetical protein
MKDTFNWFPTFIRQRFAWVVIFCAGSTICRAGDPGAFPIVPGYTGPATLNLSRPVPNYLHYLQWNFDRLQSTADQSCPTFCQAVQVTSLISATDSGTQVRFGGDGKNLVFDFRSHGELDRLQGNVHVFDFGMVSLDLDAEEILKRDNMARVMGQTYSASASFEADFDVPYLNWYDSTETPHPFITFGFSAEPRVETGPRSRWMVFDKSSLFDFDATMKWKSIHVDLSIGMDGKPEFAWTIHLPRFR